LTRKESLVTLVAFVTAISEINRNYEDSLREHFREGLSEIKPSFFAKRFIHNIIDNKIFAYEKLINAIKCDINPISFLSN